MQNLKSSGPSYSKLIMSLVNVFSKNTCELDIRTVNILTTKELVKLTMLWSTAPRSAHTFYSLMRHSVFSKTFYCSKDSESRWWRPRSDWRYYKGSFLLVWQMLPWILTFKTFYHVHLYILEEHRPWSDYTVRVKYLYRFETLPKSCLYVYITSCSMCIYIKKTQISLQTNLEYHGK